MKIIFHKYFSITKLLEQLAANKMHGNYIIVTNSCALLNKGSLPQKFWMHDSNLLFLYS